MMNSLKEEVKVIGFLNTEIKSQCFGCEACVQSCPVSAITMYEDEERFRYPMIDINKCIKCNKCHKVCPYEKKVEPAKDKKIVFGGQNQNVEILSESTSGGAFSAIVEGWCDKNYVIFGVESKGLEAVHTFIEDKSELYRFRRSKYIQSEIGTSYSDVKRFLNKGKKVLFSGTPCQIAGLRSYLGNVDICNLLTVEVICEGVPTPHYLDRYKEYIEKKYKCSIDTLDYRYKDMKSLKNPISGKWDFQVMNVLLKNGKQIKKDRWFNPFWSIWLKHLMSRPSCYECPFANSERVADITLGDLWGVHLYCPELYYKNSGASLIVCNTEKGKEVLKAATLFLKGHELEFESALKYQSPMRKHIDVNDRRKDFMKDVKFMEYSELCKKWADKPNIKLLWQKYVWGNRQKVWFWNLKNRREK